MLELQPLKVTILKEKSHICEVIVYNRQVRYEQLTWCTK